MIKHAWKASTEVGYDHFIVQLGDDHYNIIYYTTWWWSLYSTTWWWSGRGEVPARNFERRTKSYQALPTGGKIFTKICGGKNLILSNYFPMFSGHGKLNIDTAEYNQVPRTSVLVLQPLWSFLFFKAALQHLVNRTQNEIWRSFFLATRRSEQLERDAKVRILRLQRNKSRGWGRFLQRGGKRQNTSAEKQGGWSS